MERLKLEDYIERKTYFFLMSTQNTEMILDIDMARNLKTNALIYSKNLLMLFLIYMRNYFSCP